MEELEFELENTQAFIAGVSSVNGRVGDVTLNASDVGATTSTYVDNKVSAEKAERESEDANLTIYINDKIATEKSERQSSDSLLNGEVNILSGRVGTNENDISTLKTSTQGIDTAIDKNVIATISISGNTSTDTINLDNGKVNIKTGATSSVTIPFPVASASEAGVMNSATFQGLQQTTDIANGLLNGAVAVSGLAGQPTQAELTSAWKTATGRTTLMNRAVIYDITNSKLWTYYTNTSTWYSASAGGGSVDVQTWTNTQAGIVKGSTEDGQIFAENDGTGSVNGWDEVKTDIQNLEQAGYQTATDVANTIASTIANTNVSDLADGDEYTKDFVVTGTITSMNPLQATVDKTFSEVYSAYQNGKQIYLIVPAINNASFKYTSINNTRISWESMVNYNTSSNYVVVRLNNEDEVEISMTPLASEAYVDTGLNSKVGFTDYATSSTGGVVKIVTSEGVAIGPQGNLRASEVNYDTYLLAGNGLNIGKGTLENVIAGRKIKSTWTGTQAEYDALTTYDDNTNYQIVEA